MYSRVVLHTSLFLLAAVVLSPVEGGQGTQSNRFEYANILSRVAAAHFAQDGRVREHLPKMAGWDAIWRFHKGSSFNIVEDGKAILAFAEKNSTISKECSKGISLVLNATADKELWGIEFLDAMGKPASGILQLDFVWPGQYDQCMNISAKVNDKVMINNNMVDIQGKYYRLEIRLPLDHLPEVFVENTPIAAIYLHDLTYGICVPSQCSKSDVLGIGEAADAVLNPLVPDILRNRTTVQSIDDPHPAVFEARHETIVAIVIFSILAFFIVTGTLYDILIFQSSPGEDDSVAMTTEKLDSTIPVNSNHEDLNATLVNYSDSIEVLSDGRRITTLTVKHKIKRYVTLGRVLLAFSMYTNGSKILSTEKSDHQIQAVNGIRVLSLGWVILGHTYYFSVALSKNLAVAKDWLSDWSFQAVLGALFAVDSFFLLSGMLCSYLTLKEMQKRNGKISWFIYYFHRFWRLTPAYMLVILMYLGLFHYWGDGPFWPQYAPGYDVCIKFWWRNLLYIQNFFSVSEQCIGWSWYLANDMQFFIITPLILIPLYRKPLVGYVIIGVLMMEQFIFRGLISVYYGLKMNIPDPQHQIDWFNEVYQRPYSRISPYLIGILTGYILWKTDRKVCMSKLTVLIGWGLALLCVTSVVFGTLNENKGHINSLQLDGLYNAMCKTVWSLGLAWIIFACNTGYGGVISEFLSSGLWGPFGRLNYCAYLVHPIVMYVYILNQRYPLYFTQLNVVYMFLGHWMMTYGVSFFISMAFEAPMIGLERILLQREKRE